MNARRFPRTTDEAFGPSRAATDGAGMSTAQHTPGPWGVHPHIRGFVVLRTNVRIPGTIGIQEVLTNDGSNQIAFDASRRDCFFVSQDKAFAAIEKAHAAESAAIDAIGSAS